MYEIRMNQTVPHSDCCLGGLRKSEVQIEPDITVNFHRDSFVESDPKIYRGLITTLKFTKI